MSKIKNWKLEQDSRRSIVWVNSVTNNDVIAFEVEPELWSVVYPTNPNKLDEIAKDITTARKIAVRWMKAHPHL